MTKPMDFLGGASPKSVLNKPIFHAQHREVYNVAGGNMVGDAWTARVFNTVIKNDIQGATLASPRINLAAGRYRVKFAQTWVAPASATSFLGAVFVNGVLQADTLSPSDYQGSGYGNVVCRGGGEVVLGEAGYVEIRYYSGEARPTNGLGLPNSNGMMADTTIPSVYAEIEIEQLDRSLEVAPVAINSGLQAISGLDTYGNVNGFNIIRAGANQITVTKGSCMSGDSSSVPLALTVDAPLTIPGTQNQLFHIFVVKLVAGGYGVKAYTTEAAVASDGMVEKWRWIGFVRNNGAGALCDFTFFPGEDIMVFNLRSESADTSGFVSTTFVDWTPTTIPVSRVAAMRIVFAPSTATTAWISLNGTTIFHQFYYGVAGVADTAVTIGTGVYDETMVPFNNNWKLRLETGYSTTIYITRIKIRR